MRAEVIAGRYRLVRQLGAGAMATVWEADDLELGRRVAVKILAADADRARFEREAHAAARLAHPNVVQVFDVGEDERGAYLVLELLSGGTLEDRLSPGAPLADAEAERIAAGIAAGLAHAHERGLVHRDLKPGNVLFDDDRPKLADLGIARLRGADTLTEAGTVLGTAATISPEQAAGEPATPASDVYSFGVILFRLLTGRLPFEADDPLTVAAMHVRDDPPSIDALRPDVPPHLAALVTAALAKDPADRPRDGRALLGALGGPTVAATAVSEGASPASRRRSAGITAAIAVLAAAGLALAVVASRDASSPPTPPRNGAPGAAATGAPTAGTAPAPASSTPTAGTPTTAPAQTTAEDTTEPATTTGAPATEPPPDTTAPVPEPLLTDTAFGVTVTAPSG
ncbi:MAG TPA: serine/threonine-protein kinase [Gaiellaceae bacterium]|nr:serine/threonine-protein kinase [Gaiellaceae bacterium]